MREEDGPVTDAGRSGADLHRGPDDNPGDGERRSLDKLAQAGLSQDKLAQEKFAQDKLAQDRLAQDRQSQKSAIRAENERVILKAAQAVFAESGFRGATTGMIADRAGIPKANLHYYFPTKEALYRRVVEHIFNIWLDAANSFDENDDPVEALTSYISKKMDISREHPMGSKVWANEILHKAPVIQDYLETILRDWTASRVAVIRRWIAEGRIDPIDPHALLYMIWATTQHYADFNHQIDTLNGGRALDDAQFADAKRTVTRIILTGIGALARRPSQGKG